MHVTATLVKSIWKYTERDFSRKSLTHRVQGFRGETSVRFHEVRHPRCVLWSKWCTMCVLVWLMYSVCTGVTVVQCLYWSDTNIFIRNLKWSRYRTGVVQRVGRGIALLFHDRGTRRGWVVSSTPRPHFTPVKDTIPILQEAGWAPGPVWTGGKISSPKGFDPWPSVAILTELPGQQLHLLVEYKLFSTYGTTTCYGAW